MRRKALFTRDGSPANRSNADFLHFLLCGVVMIAPWIVLLVGGAAATNEGLIAYCEVNRDALAKLYTPARLIAYLRPMPVCDTSATIWMDFLYFLTGVLFVYLIARVLLRIAIHGPYYVSVSLGPESAEADDRKFLLAAFASFGGLLFLAAGSGHFMEAMLSARRMPGGILGWMMLTLWYTTLKGTACVVIPATLIFTARLGYDLIYSTDRR